MAKANQFEAMAAEAAERLTRAAEAGEQLSFLPDEGAGADSGLVDGQKRTRGKGKALTQMREFLTARGWQLPEDVLGQMAGLASGVDPMLTAMSQAERVLNWMGDGAVMTLYSPDRGHYVPKGPDGEPMPYAPTPEQKLQVFMQIYTIMLRSAEALLPYGMAKAGPDVAVQQNVQVVVPSAPASRREPRDVTPLAPSIMAPPPMPGEMQQNQQLSASDPRGSDAE